MFNRQSQEFQLIEIAEPSVFTGDELKNIESILLEKVTLNLYAKKDLKFSHEGHVLIKDSEIVILQLGKEEELLAMSFIDVNLSYLGSEQDDEAITLSKGTDILELVCSTAMDCQKLFQLLETYVITKDFYKQFKEVKVLGSGASGEVLLVECRATSQRFAAKKFSREYIYLKKNRYQQLINEIKLHQLLKTCSAVVRLIRIVEDEESVYFILEEMKGGSLFDLLISRGKHLEEEEVIHVMEQILLSADLLHSNNIVHRDIKLENILVVEKYTDDDLLNLQVKLCDLGVAKQLETPEEKGLICGTPGYIAPEILNSKHFGTKADIFSIGATMFSLLKYSNLIYDEDEDEMLSKNKAFQVEELENRIAHFQSNIKGLLYGLLQQDPQKRYSAKQALSQEWFQQDFEAIKFALKLNKRSWISSQKSCSSFKECVKVLCISSYTFQKGQSSVGNPVNNESNSVEEEKNHQSSNVQRPDSNINNHQYFWNESIEDDEYFQMKLSKKHSDQSPNHENINKSPEGSKRLKSDNSYCQLLQQKRKNSNQSSNNQMTKKNKSSFYYKHKKDMIEINIQSNGSQENEADEESQLRISKEFSIEDFYSKKLEQYCKEEYKLDFAAKDKPWIEPCKAN